MAFQSVGLCPKAPGRYMAAACETRASQETLLQGDGWFAEPKWDVATGKIAHVEIAKSPRELENWRLWLFPV